MPFGLANILAIFQSYINRALVGLINIYYIIYLDNILIYSTNPADHQRHIREILKRFRNFKLYLKLSRCEFSINRVKFLSFMIITRDIDIEGSKVKVITNWSESRSFRDIQIFLNFANFYRRFITKYWRIIAPLTGILKNSVEDKKTG